MTVRPRAASRVAITAATLVASGCGEGLQLVRDERLRFTHPPSRSFVQPPVTVAWQLRREAGRPDPHAFGVFVDRSPMAPGRDVRALAEGDPLCRAALRCPDRQWLEDRGILLTRRRHVRLEALPAQRGRLMGDRRLHEVTVVPLDERGARIGESAWTLRFFTPRGVG